MVPAEEAQARGLVGEVVVDDFPDAVARQAAEAQLAALAPLGVRPVSAWCGSEP